MAKDETAKLPALPRMKAHLDADDKDIPQLKNWEVDKVYTLEIKAKLTGLQRDSYGEGSPLMGHFEVQSIESDDDDPGLKGFDSYKGDKERPKGR